jgi:copper chaperone CopZ
MKYIICCFFIIAILNSVRLFGQGQLISASLTANGLTCSMCSKAVYKALLKVPSIKNVQVDVQKSSFQIVFDDKVRADLGRVKKAVEDAGFSVASLRLNAFFDHVAIANDVQLLLQGARLEFSDVKQQMLNGETTLRVIDKNYLPESAYAKYKLYLNGKSAVSDKIESIQVYHVTL